MRFQVLGSLTMHDEHGPVPVRAPKSRLLLALLLSHTGQVVSLSRLEDWLWDGPAPSTAALRWHVHQVRSLVGADRLVRDHDGIRLLVDRDELDAARFEDALRAGLQHEGAGESHEAARVLREALAWWHGPAYDGFNHVAPLADEGHRLDELRTVALEHRIGADLELGRHDEVAVEVAGLVARDPLREHLRVLQVRALADSGRGAEALAAFDDARATLVREIGMDPGEQLQRLHRELLAAKSAPVEPAPEGVAQEGVAPPPGGREADVAPPRPVPAELPAAVGTFTGREVELKHVVGELEPGGSRVVVVSGAGGSGKSALALQAAHHVSEAFPDGQLYVDLLGSTPGMSPRTPLEVLHRFLRSLGDERGARLADLDESAARYRSATSGRRLLVLLDNAADADQVRLLLPAATSSAVIVTGRRSMTTVEGASHLGLSRLTQDEARHMLEELLGSGRVAEDLAAADRLAVLCDRMPLALRVAAARLAAHPARPLPELTDRLEDCSRRLEELAQDDRAVRTSLGVSFDDLGADERRLLLLIALLDVPDVTGPLVAALGNVGPTSAARALDRLTEAHLLEEAEPGRHLLHDLTRLFAREQAASDLGPRAREEAMVRALHWYIASTRHALAGSGRGSQHRWKRGVPPAEVIVAGAEFATETDAMGWLDAELGNVVAASWQAIGGPVHLHAAAHALASAAVPALASRHLHTEQLALARALLEITPEEQGGAWVHLDVGNAHLQLGDPAAAELHGRAAQRLFAGAGGTVGEAMAHGIVGTAVGDQGRGADAAAMFRRGLELARAADDLVLASDFANNLADGLMLLGRFAEAVPFAEQAVELDRRLGRLRHHGLSLVTLAEAQMLAGDPEAALVVLPQAIDRLQRCREQLPEALARWRHGQALDLLHRADEAHEQRRASLEILTALDRLSTRDAESLLREAEPTLPSVLLLPY